MVGEAHEARLVGESVVVEADILAAQVQVDGGRRAVIVRQVKDAADVVEGEPRVYAGHRQQVLDAGVGVVGAERLGGVSSARGAHERHGFEDDVALGDGLRDRVFERHLAVRGRAGRGEH